MPGEVFFPGETKVRPGFYYRRRNIGLPAIPGTIQGIVATLFQSSWGPLGSSVVFEDGDTLTISDQYGTDAGVDSVYEAFLGGARKVRARRVGSGGTKATENFVDTTLVPADILRIDAKYFGTRGNSLLISIVDAPVVGFKDILVYLGTRLVQAPIRFQSGAGGEAAKAAAAITASNSKWISGTEIIAGNGVLATVADVALLTGANPTVVNADYSTAATGMSSETFNELVCDSNTTAVHVLLDSYVQERRDNGKFVNLTVGEPSSVAYATRLTNSAAFNHEFTRYAITGFIGLDEVTREGFRAAARIAGMIAGSALRESITHKVVNQAVALTESLTETDIEDAINAGAVIFSLNASEQVQVEYGVNTLVTPGVEQNDGDKKIKRMRIRDNLIERVSIVNDGLVGKIDNDSDGHGIVIASARRIVDQMIADKLLRSDPEPVVKIDDNNPPAGDVANFVIEVDDVDSLEKIFVTFGFRFAPPA